VVSREISERSTKSVQPPPSAFGTYCPNTTVRSQRRERRRDRALDAKGNFAVPFNSEGMYRGWIGPDGEPRVAM
jgi:hypothetical protein